MSTPLRLVWSQPAPSRSHALLDDILALLDQQSGGDPMTARRKDTAPLDVEARLARHDARLDDHEQRLSAIEHQAHEYRYEFDILSRLTLRNARRIDRLDGHQRKKRRR